MFKIHTKMFTTYQCVALTRHGPWRKEWKTASVFLPWEPHDSMKRQKDMTLKDELPTSVGFQYAAGKKSGEIASQRMKRVSQSKNNTQLQM